MARKPESQFIASVHGHFGEGAPHWEKNWNAYRGGTPDVFYSGDKGCLWIEYKFLPKLPKKLRLALSPLQAQWLRARHEEGRRVAVVLGLPTGGILFDGVEWDGPRAEDDLLFTQIRSREHIARWITRQVGRAST